MDPKALIRDSSIPPSFLAARFVMIKYLSCMFYLETIVSFQLSTHLQIILSFLVPTSMIAQQMLHSVVVDLLIKNKAGYTLKQNAVTQF
jgi:uncharacterized protein (DUF983 family)